jgi:hypothetical protein
MKLSEWKQFGCPCGLFFDKNDLPYCTDSELTAAVDRGLQRGLTIGSRNSSVGGCGITLLPVSGGATRRRR